MGSDMGNRKHAHDSQKLMVWVLAGCLFALYVSFVPAWFAMDANQCELSFGAYKGSLYRTDMTVGESKCLVESKFLKVQQHSVQFPSADGSKKKPPLIEDWIWIDYHDRINVLVEAPSSIQGASSSETRFLIFEQSKYALEGRQSLAIVGGIIEPGEQPEAAAEREVLEETNMACADFVFLGRYRTDVNRGMGWTIAIKNISCIGIRTITAAAPSCSILFYDKQHHVKPHTSRKTESEKEETIWRIVG